MSRDDFYDRHFSDPRLERAFLSAVSFTTTFAVVRGITHAIRAGRGPFRNISAGGTHIHHSTFGIFGLIGIGFVWTRQWGTGVGECNRWGSRTSASLYGVACALTLDEFALWLDLHDDYWDRQGRKSIDAVALFGGLLGISVTGRDALHELGLLPHALDELVKRDRRRRGIES
jgi:Na+/proline symporter